MPTRHDNDTQSGRVMSAGHGGPSEWVKSGILIPALLALSGAAVYAGGIHGAFLFDDKPHIVEAQRIRHLVPLGDLLSGRRPVVDLTLAVNYAISELDTWSYRVVNISVHILAALALFGVVRRTAFQLTSSAHARWLALVVALLFVVHPLQSQSVNYTIQRGESLMSLFYLLTLYCVIRGAAAGAAGRSQSVKGWYVAAIMACAMGMGSKAVMVTAPLMVLLYDRTFLSSSFIEAIRRRWALYAGLVATWSVVAVCGVLPGVLSTTRRAATVGFSYKAVSPIEYALTQLGVLTHYLRLTIWPFPLCLDHEWPVADTLLAIGLPAIFLVVVVFTAVRHFRRRPWALFLVGWFFLVLAPTSTLVPVKDALFEHRMYLALAAVLIMAAAGGHALLDHVGHRFSLDENARRVLMTITVLAAAICLGTATHRRNVAYASGVSMWSDVVAKRPHNARAYNNLGNAQLDAGDEALAMQSFAVALRMRPEFAEAANNLGKGLKAMGRVNEAIKAYRDALTHRPGFAQAHNNLGNALREVGEFDAALRHFDEAIRLRPTYANAYNNRGLLYANNLNDARRAIADYDTAIELNPLYAGTYYSRGRAYAGLGELDDAIADYNEAIRRDPGLAEAFFGRGNAFATKGKFDQAVDDFDQALKLRPTYMEACFRKAMACEGAGRAADAAQAYRQYLQLLPPDQIELMERVRERIRKLEQR